MVVDFIEVNTLAKTREDLSKSYVAIVLACLSDPVGSQKHEDILNDVWYFED